MLRTVLACTTLIMVQQTALSQTVVSDNSSPVVRSVTTQRPVTSSQPTTVRSAGTPIYDSSRIVYSNSAPMSGGRVIYQSSPSFRNGTIIQSSPGSTTYSQPVSSNGTRVYSQPMNSQPVYSQPVYSQQGRIVQSSYSQNLPAGQSYPGSGGGNSELLNLVNNERAQRGLAPLSMDPGLMSGAQGHSMNQQRSGRMYHARSYGAAENVANGAHSAQQVMRMWMNSPGHRANILNPNYRFFGGGQSGSFWTQRFR